MTSDRASQPRQARDAHQGWALVTDENAAAERPARAQPRPIVWSFGLNAARWSARAAGRRGLHSARGTC
ncbi:MAG: hypothetical protein ACRDF0_00215 [Candidatus Limnocylindria bacterium]